MTTVLVTGAGGYIGQRLVASLVAGGLAVRALVRAPVPWGLGSGTEFEEVVGDLVAEPGLAREVGAGTDVVVHLAGANEVRAAADPEGSMSDTVLAAERVAACGIGRVIYLSTVHVYGDALRAGAVVNEDTPTGPLHPYAAARLACEGIFARSGVPSVIFRLTNGVGAPSRPEVRRWSLVANELCREGAVHGRLTLRTAGVQWRDFVALADVERIVGALAGDRGGGGGGGGGGAFEGGAFEGGAFEGGAFEGGAFEGGAFEGGAFEGGTYNLASGRSVTIRDLASLVQESFVGFGEPRPELVAPGVVGDGPAPYRMDVSRLAARGFTAETPLRDAVDETVRFCLDNRSSLA